MICTVPLQYLWNLCTVSYGLQGKLDNFEDFIILIILTIKGEACPSVYADWVNGGWF